MKYLPVSTLTCLLIYCSTVRAAEIFVAPNGDDRAIGSIDKPLATLSAAQRRARPGDTVWLRGGTYKMATSQIASQKGSFARLIVLDKSGTPESPIFYRAYRNERPVLDCSAVRPDGVRVSAFYISGSWLRLVGMEVTGVQVTMRSHTQSICFESQGSHNVLERLRMHDGQAIGIYHVRGSDNLFLNCDAWNNWDATSDDGKGENVDGFGCHPTKGSTGNLFRGCRAWFNSDDGFDCINAQEAVVFERCWAFCNGFSPDFKSLANGNGFKVGGYGVQADATIPEPVPRHEVRFCLAVRNKANGFYANHHPGGCDWLNNTAYRNGANFNMLGRKDDRQTSVDGFGHKLVNNLSYGSRTDLTAIDRASCVLMGNSFDMPWRLIDRDFESLDERLLLTERQKNGDLPRTTLLRPVKGSRASHQGYSAQPLKKVHP